MNKGQGIDIKLSNNYYVYHIFLMFCFFVLKEVPLIFLLSLLLKFALNGLQYLLEVCFP